MRLAASLEKSSEHPLARAIVNEAEKRKLKLSEVKEFKILRGRGAEGKLNGKKILIGNRKLMEENKIKLDSLEKKCRN